MAKPTPAIIILWVVNGMTQLIEHAERLSAGESTPSELRKRNEEKWTVVKPLSILQLKIHNIILFLKM